MVPTIETSKHAELVIFAGAGSWGEGGGGGRVS